MGQIRQAVTKIPDEKERTHLKELLDNIYDKEFESEDEEELLNFANLKKIDRVSIRKVEKKKSILSFCEDQVMIYESGENIQESSRELSQSEIQKII